MRNPGRMRRVWNGQSIRNEIPGTVKEIISDNVLSEIIVETAVGDVAAIITTRSVNDMGLKVGDQVAALVKATNVSIRRQGERCSSRSSSQLDPLYKASTYVGFTLFRSVNGVLNPQARKLTSPQIWARRDD